MRKKGKTFFVVSYAVAKASTITPHAPAESHAFTRLFRSKDQAMEAIRRHIGFLPDGARVELMEGQTAVLFYGTETYSYAITEVEMAAEDAA